MEKHVSFISCRCTQTRIIDPVGRIALRKDERLASRSLEVSSSARQVCMKNLASPLHYHFNLSGESDISDLQQATFYTTHNQ